MLSDLIIGRTLLICCEVLHAQVKTKITRRRLSCAVIFIISQQTRKQKRKMYRSNIFLKDYYKTSYIISISSLLKLIIAPQFFSGFLYLTKFIYVV